MHDGELQRSVDSRLAFILEHQARVPESMGRMVPEYVESLSDYRRRILRPMYRAVDGLPEANRIRHEFLNARGAVFKLSRDSMEVRVLDMQECVKRDVAIAAFVRGALRALAGRIRKRRLELPDHDDLVADFHEVVAKGTRARVRASWLPDLPRDGKGLARAADAIAALLPLARDQLRADETPYLDLVAATLQEGNLSERVSRVLLPFAEDAAEFTEAARRLYIRLSECLTENEPWNGRL
jgi:hypothetical protein